MQVVVALGGNALSPPGGTGSTEEMRASLAGAGAALAELVGAGAALVLTHGNGPQIGRLLLQQEAAALEVPPMPMDVCGAATQGQLGYLLAEALGAALRRRGLRQQVLPLVTQVIVDRADPAFATPTKPVGPTYDTAVARALAAGSGHLFGEVRPGRWRRLVPSPRPIGFVEAEPIRLLAGSGHVLIAGGGGGVPVVPEPDGGYPRGRGGGRQGPDGGRAGRPRRRRGAGHPHRGAAGPARLGYAGRRGVASSPSPRPAGCSPPASSRPGRWGRRSRRAATSSPAAGGGP